MCILAGGPGTNAGPGGGPSGGSDHSKDGAGPSTLNQSAATTGSASQQSGQSGSNARSPPPQRHVHTHHHTHVGLGYPMFQAPYGGTYIDNVNHD